MVSTDPDPLRSAAAVRPAQPAVIDRDEGEACTYESLDRTADRVATGLAARDVDPGERVAIALPAGVQFAAIWHAIRRCGAVAAPIDPALDPERRGQLLERIAPAIVIDGEGAGGADGSESTTVEALRASGAESLAPTERRADATACLMATSGTTGRPRLVELTRLNLRMSAFASALRLGVLPEDRWLAPLAPHHLGGLAPLVRSGYYGTTYVAQSFDETAIAETLAEAGITGISLVPVMLRRLLDTETPLDQLRFVLVGGDRTPRALVERALTCGIALHPTYGMTETASQIATATPEDTSDNPDSVGRPLRWVDVQLAQSDIGPADAGEIVVTGPIVAKGYWQDVAGTQDCFTSEGFRTGDLGRFDDAGRLVVLGRCDERIVSGGETVDPRAVERVLTATEGIQEAAVVGVPDPEWGERVCALIVSSGEADPDLEAAMAQLRPSERPKEIATASTLPRTASGTVDRTRVRERFSSGTGREGL